MTSPVRPRRHPYYLRALLLLFVLTSILPVATRAQTRRAVLVGINLYNPPGVEPQAHVVSAGSSSGGGSATGAPPPGRGSWVNLHGSLNDVESVKQLLITRYGFQEKDVHVLADQEATHEAILAALQTYLVDAASPGDISFFYYAGHGSQMTNSKSWKQDKLDETTIPADSFKGTWDIRDKEYSRYFMKVINKGAILTAIFDSCHSGSVTRGYSPFNRVRAMPADPRDSADDYSGPFPEKKGALVFAAAQDTESAAEGRDENGVEHGAFTASLIKVLATAPVNESADDIFEQTFALMRSQGASQVPVISGSAERIRGPLFGASAGTLSGKLTLPVVTVDGNGAVDLFGGFTLGFGVGSELVPAQKDGPAAGVRLKITEQNPAKSTAKVLAGSVTKISPGTLFTVDRWVPASKGVLDLWVPTANLSIAELQHAAGEVAKIRELQGITVVDDPYEVTPTHIISWNGTAWILSDQSTRAEKPLGRNPDLAAAAKNLPADKTKLFVNLPLPQDDAHAITELGSAQSPTRIVPSIKEANYVLVGRAPSDSGVEYAWLLPGAAKDASTALKESTDKTGKSQQVTLRAASSLPPETRWISAKFTKEGFQEAATSLSELAGSLARIHGWLDLTSPPDDGNFPYHLAVVETDHPTAADPVKNTFGDGRWYGLALRADKKDLDKYVEPRRIYVFVIDSDGNGVPIFPPVEFGDVQNVLPRPESTTNGLPEQIPLGPAKLFQVGEPYGTDTYFLLTTAPQDSINLASLKWEGVRGGQRGAAGSPLDQLLSSVGTRSPKPAVPSSWSLTRVPVQSSAKP